MALKECVGDTSGQHVEFQFDWKVENFFSLSEEVNDFYSSSDFQFLGRFFHLRLYPSCRRSDRSGRSIGLYLVPSGPCALIKVECTLGIKTSKGEIEEWVTLTKEVQDSLAVIGTECLTRSKLLKQRQELAPSDAVTFTVSMKTNFPWPKAPETGGEDYAPEGSADILEYLRQKTKRTTEVAVQTSLEDVDNDRDDTSQLPEKTGAVKVAEDLGKLWGNSENSDVILRVGDVEFEFRAHRAILSARTPVLRALLSRDSEEKEPDVVTITDCEPKVFGEFLNYVYTGSLRELTTKTAFGLYTLAEKYLVGDLKTQCVRYFRSALSVETFCDAVLLALTHGEVALLQEIVDFAAENVRLIIKSVEWQKFHVEHPKEANEILVKALCSHETGNDE